MGIRHSGIKQQCSFQTPSSQQLQQVMTRQSWQNIDNTYFLNQLQARNVTSTTITILFIFKIIYFNNYYELLIIFVILIYIIYLLT